MTALELIDNILQRPQNGMPPRERIITPDQLDYLRILISQSGHCSTLRSDGPFTQLWTPPGKRKFLLIENSRGRGHRLVELPAHDAAEMDSLF